MKILIVSWYFPPANTIAAVRMGRMARFLLSEGHDVRVLAGKDLPYAQTLPLQLPDDRAAYAPWRDVNRLPDLAIAAVRRAVPGRRMRGSGNASSGGGTNGGSAKDATDGFRELRSRLSNLYIHLTNIPDSRVGWFPAAVRRGHDLIGTWRPDVIYASGPPFTGLLIGHRLSRRHGIPLIIELRDRWADDPYYPPPAWRNAIDRWLERRVLNPAVGIVTVSEPWADFYGRRYGRPVETVCNGYDPDVGAEPGPTARGDELRIVYTGGIYPGIRDPSPLFAAMARLPEGVGTVRVDFYGTDEATVRPIADRFGVGDRVTVHPGVPHADSVRLQRTADVLLLMQWDSPQEQGNVPGKFFEYLGARRPILLHGLKDGVPATIIRDRGAGFFGNEADAVAAQLARWLDQKRAAGVPATPDTAAAGYSRDEQFARIVPFLRRVLPDARPAGERRVLPAR